MRTIALLLTMIATACTMPIDDTEGPTPEDRKNCKQVCEEMPDMCKSCQQAPEFGGDGLSPDPLPWRPTVPPSRPRP